MAHLQMAPYPYREDTIEGKLPTLRGEAPKTISRLEKLRNEYQERVLKEKDEKLLCFLTQKQVITSKRVNGLPDGPLQHHADACNYTERKQIYSSKHSPASNQAVSGLERKNWSSNWVGQKRSVGVDRAHPLKPVYPNKYPGSIGNVNRLPSANTAGFKPSPSLTDLVRSKSGPSRTAPWSQLQETEFNLEAEIRRKEALLKEKLRRTEEELRRIQREKEQAELEERKIKEKKEGRRRVSKNQKKATKNYSILGSSEDDDGNYNNQVQGGLYKAAELNLLTMAPSPPPQDIRHRVEKLKREHIVTSNTMKIPSTQTSSPKYAEESYMSPSLKTQPVTGGVNRRMYSESEEEEEELSMLNAPDELNVNLVPCKVCGRRFAEQRLEKHMFACNKIQSSKRKVFDSSKARAKGTELEQFLHTKGRVQARAPQVPSSTWRQKHESFMRTIRQAREVQHVIAKGGKLSDLPPLPPDENPDYVPCPHCNRRFAPRAAERHIPKCETIKSKPRPPPQRKR